MQEESANSLVRIRQEDEVVKGAETVLKKRHHDVELKAERARKLKELKLDAKKVHKPKGPISLESIVKATRRKFVDQRRQRRVVKNLPPKLKMKQEETKIFLVVRNLEKHGSKATVQSLKALGLTNKGAAVFLPNTKEALKNIKGIEPYVFYGHPTSEIIRDLFIKRGYLKLDAQSIEPVSNNLLVEEAFGDEGMLSVEDLVHEVYVCGPAFSAISTKLQPFQLETLRKPECGFDSGMLKGYQSDFNDVITRLL